MRCIGRAPVSSTSSFWRIRAARFGRERIGAWSIPKGEYTGGEDPWLAARRELGGDRAVCLDGPRIDSWVAETVRRKVVTVFGVLRSGKMKNELRLAVPSCHGMMTC